MYRARRISPRPFTARRLRLLGRAPRPFRPAVRPAARPLANPAELLVANPGRRAKRGAARGSPDFGRISAKWRREGRPGKWTNFVKKNRHLTVDPKALKKASKPRKLSAAQKAARKAARARRMARAIAEQQIGTRREAQRRRYSKVMEKRTASSKKNSKKKMKRMKRKLLAQVRARRKAIAKHPKRSLSRSRAVAQYHRAVALRRQILASGPRSARKSPVAKAMHLRTNGPLLDGLKHAAPQVIAGGAALLGLAFAGKKLSDMIADKAPDAIRPYTKSISTAVLAGVGFAAANAVVPKFKGVVLIGGLLASIIQAITANRSGGALTEAFAVQQIAPSSAPAPIDPNLTTAVTPAPTTGGFGGFGDYTTVGQRGYAEAGIFRNTGGMGAIHRGLLAGGHDNATEWARDSLRGLDDATEFAPGEGGILAGGIFRGSSSR